MSKADQIRYHIEQLRALTSDSTEFRIATPDLSHYEYGIDPEALANRWWEGFNSPQQYVGGSWRTMQRVNDRWV